MAQSAVIAPQGESRPAWLSPEQASLASHFVVVDGPDSLGALTGAWTALREAAVAAAEAAVQARSLAALLDEALAALREHEGAGSVAPASTPVAASWRDADPLSPREREVLALVAEGYTNKAIAEALFVSPNTIKTHVASLLYKLRADTRVQLAAIAARQGLHLQQLTAPGAR
jgi:DNA-binding CsgD family transcriptional regulator